MEASIVDLRYNMSEIRKAIEHNELVKITCHGRIIANIVPCNINKQEKIRVDEHPFFGSLKNIEETSVEEIINKLRGNRYDAL